MGKELFDVEQRHGKARVRLGRVWRNGVHHSFVEWNLSIILSSNCLPAYTHGNNSAIVATDSIKNTVYAKAKECKNPLPMEEFGILLGQHFVQTYPQVTGAVVSIVEKPWNPIKIDDKVHGHGFQLGTERRTTEIYVKGDATTEMTSGISCLSMLKTTQSGFEGFVHDKYTLLPEVRERILATTLEAVWSYSSKPLCYDKAFDVVKKTLVDTFFGPPLVGLYSPSVQNTLYVMGTAVLQRLPEVKMIKLSMPNLHFLPVNIPAVGAKFEDDLYLPTDEPHGTIEACVMRKHHKSVSKL